MTSKSTDAEPAVASAETETVGQLAVERAKLTMAEKFEYYRRSYAWQAKNPAAVDHLLQLFFEWGFTDGMELGIDVGAKLIRGEKP